MSTASDLLRSSDREVLNAIRSGRADPAVLDAFRRQLVGGMAAPIIGEREERQEDFTRPRPTSPEDPDQLALF